MEDRPNFFLRLVAALHESRQRQAALEIKRHAHLLNLQPALMPSRRTYKEVVRTNAIVPRSQTTVYRMSSTAIKTALIVGALMIFGTVHVIGYSYIERDHGSRGSFEVPRHMLSAD
jgi:hypothetical protein